MAKKYTNQKRVKWKYYNGVWTYVFDGKNLATARTVEEKREIEKRWENKIRLQFAIEKDEEERLLEMR